MPTRKKAKARKRGKMVEKTVTVHTLINAGATFHRRRSPESCGCGGYDYYAIAQMPGQNDYVAFYPDGTIYDQHMDQERVDKLAKSKVKEFPSLVLYDEDGTEMWPLSDSNDAKLYMKEGSGRTVKPYAWHKLATWA